MIENIQHDYFIWEEKNSTEPKTKLENNGVNEEAVSMSETKIDLTQKDWKDITDPKLRRKMRLKEYCKNYRKINKDKIKSNKKIYNEFNKDKIKIKQKFYRENNKEKLKDYFKNHYEVNKNKKKLYYASWKKINKNKLKDYQKKYHKNNSYKRNKYEKKRLKIDIQYKLRNNLRTRLNGAIKGNYKAGSAVRDLGCTIDELKSYLESKFLPNMTWDNWSKDGWHIDHIKPLSSFDLSDRKQLLEACHYTNLQPLWAKDNLTKSDKII